MQITLNKTELAGALAALGKLVSRTSLIKMYQGTLLSGKSFGLWLKTSAPALY